MPQMVYIVRGLPGAGKTTFAAAAAKWLETLTGEWVGQISADQFMEDDEGKYTYDPSRITECHESAQKLMLEYLHNGANTVIIHNTFSRGWEIESYTDLLPRKVKVRVFNVKPNLSPSQLEKRNIHNVPLKVIEIMKDRWEPYIGEVTVKEFEC